MKTYLYLTLLLVSAKLSAQNAFIKFDPAQECYDRWKSDWNSSEFDCRTFYYTNYINPAVINTIKEEISFNYYELKRDSLWSEAYVKGVVLDSTELHLVFRFLDSLPFKKSKYSFSFATELGKDSLGSKLSFSLNKENQINKRACTVIYYRSQPFYLTTRSSFIVFEKEYSMIGSEGRLVMYKLKNGKWEKDALLWVGIEENPVV